jgi:lipopolysaccharide transport system permease protein
MNETTSSGPLLTPPILVIEAGQAEANYWGDLWRYRELFYFLTWRDLLVRYKQTVVGVTWAFIQPAVTLLIFSIVGSLLKVPTNGFPRPVTVFAALLPWQFFSSSLSSASGSLVGNANLISKVYFPRLIIPVSAVAVSLVDFLISAIFLGILMVYFRVVPDARILALPCFILIAFGTALGAGLWLTALTVKYRDFRFVLPFIVQFGLYVSPVAFTSDIVPARWRALYALNPMVGVIDGFRWALLRGSTELSPVSMGVSIGTTFVVLASGISYFRSVEKRFADLI